MFFSSLKINSRKQSWRKLPKRLTSIFTVKEKAKTIRMPKQHMPLMIWWVWHGPLKIFYSLSSLLYQSNLLHYNIQFSFIEGHCWITGEIWTRSRTGSTKRGKHHCRGPLVCGFKRGRLCNSCDEEIALWTRCLGILQYDDPARTQSPDF